MAHSQDKVELAFWRKWRNWHARWQQVALPSQA
jgi:hypothetical protein